MGYFLLLPRVPFPLRAPIPKPLLLSNSPPLCEPTPPASGPSTGWAGTLTPGHLDELSDAEHTGGDEALLEVGGVWKREEGWGSAGGQLSWVCSPP